MKKLICLILALLLMLSFIGCSNNTEPADPDIAPEPEEEEEEEVEITYNEIVTSQIDGVYENEKGMIVIRNVQVGACSFIADITTAEPAGYFAGTAERDDTAITFTDTGFSFNIKIEGDCLTLEEFGANPLVPKGSFDGVYTRTDKDPYDIIVDDERSEPSGTDGLPPSVSDTILDGNAVNIYIDPTGKFSAIFPSLFYASADQQPEGGIRLIGDIGRISIAIYPDTAYGASSVNELADKLKTEIPDAVISELERAVSAEFAAESFNGEEMTSFKYFYVTDSESYIVEFTYPTAEADFYASQTADIEIVTN